MEQLTAGQLIQMAKELKIIARSINDYQIDNWDNLTPEQFNELNKAEREILNTVQEMIAQSVIVLAEDSQALIRQVTAASTQIDQSIKQIDNINKVLEIATASVFLVSAIASQNPAAIGQSLDGVLSVLLND